MRYYINDENDLTVFRDIFGTAWETAASMNDKLGAFLLLDEFGRVVLEENAARFFGIAEGEIPAYSELKELVTTAESCPADIEIALLDSRDDITAGFAEYGCSVDVEDGHPVEVAGEGGMCFGEVGGFLFFNDF